MPTSTKTFSDDEAQRLFQAWINIPFAGTVSLAYEVGERVRSVDGVVLLLEGLATELARVADQQRVDHEELTQLRQQRSAIRAFLGT